MWNTLERLEVAVLARRQPRGPLPVPDQPPGTDLLPQIRHIVVLMMENHSYDNYLGTLRGRGEGLPLGADGQPSAANPGQGGEQIRAHRMSSIVQQPGVPSQSWHATHLQWGEGRLDGFVTSTQTVMSEAGADPDAIAAAADVAMGYWTEAELPFYNGLARTFPVADHWFSSCLGPTFPNRRFLIAGTAHGLIDDSPYDLLDYPAAGTIFDLLTRHGVSWANYHPDSDDQGRLTRYARHKRKMARRRLQSAGQVLSSTAGALKKDITFTADVFPVGAGRMAAHIRSTTDFFAAADRGELPAISFVDPDFDAFSEENPQDIRKGESFAAEVIRHVMHGPGWPHTLLIWTYDEHGGYYDHVPPPAAVPPDDIRGRSLVGRRSRLAAALRPLAPRKIRDKENMTSGPDSYDRYGFRVPAVIVSPYARRDFVLSDVLDHTSVLRLIEDKWNLPSLTARDAAARTPLGALDLDAPPAFLDPPDLPAPSLAWPGAAGSTGMTACRGVWAANRAVRSGMQTTSAVHVPGRARRASRGRTAHVLARLGLTARGIIYLLVGWVAIEVALGHRHRETDQAGALHLLARQPYGLVLLWLLAIGFASYALWRLSEAAFGVTGDRPGAGPRLKSLGRAVIYAGFAYLTFSVISGRHRSQSRQQQDLTARAMQHDGGQWLVGIAGLVVVIIALYLVFEGVQRKFLKYLNIAQLRPRVRRGVELLGMIGTIARGVIFALAGVLVIEAAVTHDPAKAGGIDKALSTLRGEPLGEILLFVAALGLIIFGVYGLCEARWRKV